MTQLFLLVEGQSEERFVKDTLMPHLESFGVQVKVSVVKTSKDRTGLARRGGGASAGKYLDDLRGIARNPNNHYISTLFDFYGFPFSSSQADVEQAEKWLAQQVDMPRPRFVPFFVKFEYEAWLLVDPERLVEHMGGGTVEVNTIHRWVHEAGGAEWVNDGPQTHPKERLQRLFGGKYRPVLHSPPILRAIGLTRIRQNCPHFNGWLTELEGLGRPETSQCRGTD